MVARSLDASVYALLARPRVDTTRCAKPVENLETGLGFQEDGQVGPPAQNDQGRTLLTKSLQHFHAGWNRPT